MLHQMQQDGKSDRAMPVWIGSNAVVAQRVRLNCRYPAFHEPRMVAVGDLHARERAGQRPCCIWSNMRRFTAHPFREGNGRAAKLFMSQLAELTSYDFDFQAVEPAVWNQRSALSRPDRGAYTPAHRELIPVFRHITIDRPTTPPSSVINDAALRAARLANRDHPTDPRTAGTRSAGHGKAPASYRPPGHYRADPGRDIER